jgi:tetratricopeptide (TPR) repeat protein
MRCCAVAILSLALHAVARGQTLDDVQALLERGDRASAVQTLERIKTRDPRNVQAHTMLGALYAEEGDRDKALAELNEAIRLAPKSAEPRDALGEAWEEWGDLARAQAQFEAAIATEPRAAHPHMNLARLLLKTGHAAESAAHLDQAIALYGAVPAAAYPHYLRARLAIDQSRFQEAEKHLRAAVGLDATFAEAWSDLGYVRKMSGDDAGALAAYRTAVGHNPDDAVAQYRFGSELFHQGQKEAAIEHLQTAARLDPEDQSSLYTLQLALRAAGETERANQVKQQLTDLLRRRDLRNQNALAAVRLNNEGAKLEHAGDIRSAAEKYGEALKLNPDHNGIRVNHAVALLRLGQWSAGLAELKEALRRDPTNAQIKAALDDALRQAPPETAGR